PFAGIIIAMMSMAAVAQPAPKFALQDTAGIVHHQDEWSKSRAVVIFFTTTDCPLSNGDEPHSCGLLSRWRGFLRGANGYDDLRNRSPALCKRVWLHIPCAAGSESDPRALDKCDRNSGSGGTVERWTNSLSWTHREARGRFREAPSGCHGIRFEERA